LDEEGGRRLEMVDEDMLQLREDLTEKLNQKVHSQLVGQTELEK
jgi:hypothetical protein